MSVDFDSLPREAQEAILNKPLALPPDGVESHLGEPRELNVMTISLTATSLFLMTVVYLLRTYSRIVYSKKLRIEDLFGFIAFGASVVHSYTVIQMDINPGTFRHSWDLQVRDLEPFFKTFNLLRTFYCVDLWFCKNAILLEWIRIFVPLPQRTPFFWICTVLIGANTALYIAAIIANYIVVVPLEALWKPWLEARYLINRQAADTAVVSFNLVCDILILFVPQRVIWKLNLHRQRKIGLSFLFGLGVLTCICAGGRVYTTAVLNWEFDTIHDVPGVVLWGVGESTFAMLVFCVPAIPKIFSGKQPGFVTKIKNTSLLSWSRLVSGGSSREGAQTGNTSQQTWPAPDISRRYRKMTDGDSEIALTDVDNREGQTTPRNIPPPQRITKTTDVFTTEDTVSETGIAAARHHAESQRHPWMTGQD